MIGTTDVSKGYTVPARNQQIAQPSPKWESGPLPERPAMNSKTELGIHSGSELHDGNSVCVCLRDRAA